MRTQMLSKSYLLSCLLSLLALSFGCDTPNRGAKFSNPSNSIRYKQAQWRRLYSGELDRASAQVTNYLMEMISPMSGKNPQYTVYLENIHFDERENMVASDVKLTWIARDFWSGVGYGECQVTGVIYVYMPIRGVDKATAVFKPSHYNDHLRKVSKQKHLDALARGVKIELRYDR